jgi:thioredoxin 1
MPDHKSSDRILSVTSNTFEPMVLAGKGPIAVEFMSYGCGHCQTIEPILQQVAQMVQPREKIFRVNVAVEPELTERCQIEGTPTFIMFLDGSVVGRTEGPSPTLASVLSTVEAPYVSS